VLNAEVPVLQAFMQEGQVHAMGSSHMPHGWVATGFYNPDRGGVVLKEPDRYLPPQDYLPERSGRQGFGPDAMVRRRYFRLWCAMRHKTMAFAHRAERHERPWPLFPVTGEVRIGEHDKLECRWVVTDPTSHAQVQRRVDVAHQTVKHFVT
jgi:hypothetical protein